MKHNIIENKFYWLYLVGFFMILALPIATSQIWFYPPDWGKAIIFRSIMAILSFFFLWQIFYKKDALNFIDIKRNPIFLSSLALLFSFLLATIFSVDINFSLWSLPYRAGGFITFVFYFIFAFILFLTAKKSDWKNFWNFSIFIGLITCTIAFIQYFGLFNRIFSSQSVRPSSIIGNPILLAIYICLLLFPAISFFITEKSKKIKIFYGISIIFFLCTILIATSRAAFLGIIIGVLFFLLAYPKKIPFIKIATLCFVALVFLFIIYANLSTNKILADNRLVGFLYSRLSLKSALGDERYPAWKIVIEEIKDKPILGWGPENLSVGFDKNFDPTIVHSSWWDKAHNIFLQVGAETGLVGLTTYILLLIVLFFQLYKEKKRTDEYNKKIIITGLQATLACYITANFFSFDSFPTYLIFFFIIAYSMHLTTNSDLQKILEPKRTWWKPVISFALFLFLIIFLWQYNFLPLKINSQINFANFLVKNKYCDQAFFIMDEVLLKKSFLDSYARTNYAEFTRPCSDYYPENNSIYAEKVERTLKESVSLRPLYTRYWISLGTIQTNALSIESDKDKKEKIIEQALFYFDKAMQLAPKHQEVLIEKAKMEMIAEDYEAMKNYANECVELAPNCGDCYFYRGVAKMYMKDSNGADQDFQTAQDKGYIIESTDSLKVLANLYVSMLEYEKLVDVYKKLIAHYPQNVQYYSSLAFCYKELGQYEKARQQAQEVLKISPESEQEVREFLKLLP